MTKNNLPQPIEWLIGNITELNNEQRRANDQRDSWDVGGWIMCFMFAGFVLFFFSKIINNAINRLAYHSARVVNHGVTRLQDSQRQTLGGAFNAMPQIIGKMMNNIENLGNALTQGSEVSNRLAITDVKQGLTVREIGTDTSDSESDNEEKKPKKKLQRSNSQELRKRAIAPQNDDLG